MDISQNVKLKIIKHLEGNLREKSLIFVTAQDFLYIISSMYHK